MGNDSKKKVSWWLELIRAIIAVVSGALGGGGLTAMM